MKTGKTIGLIADIISTVVAVSDQPGFNTKYEANARLVVIGMYSPDS
jgi:hypothetical protein